MRRIIAAVLLAPAFLLPATGAHSQNSFIGLWSQWSPPSHSCVYWSDPPGLITLYIVHHANAGTGGSLFRIEPSADLTMVYQSETIHMGPWRGNLRDGIEISYGMCLQGDWLVATVTYLADGNTPPCSYITVAPHPDAESGEVEVMNCDAVWVPATWVTEIYVINGGTSCVPWCWSSPTEKTTWGAIKALYQ